MLWLAAAAVKAQDELAALGLDGRLASQKMPDIRAKENIRYELTQPQQLLTSTGLLMEGQVTFPEPPSLEIRIGDLRVDRDKTDRQCALDQFQMV